MLDDIDLAALSQPLTDHDRGKIETDPSKGPHYSIWVTTQDETLFAGSTDHPVTAGWKAAEYIGQPGIVSTMVRNNWINRNPSIER